MYCFRFCFSWKVCTSVVSFLAVVAYVPLVSMMPKPATEDPEELKDLSYYEALSDEEFAELPARIADEVRFQSLGLGVFVGVKRCQQL